MIVTRAVVVFAVLVYAVLWALALHGDPTLVPVLVVPPVLAVLVAIGVWLNDFVGITPRAQHFVEPDDAAGSDAARSDAARSDAAGSDAADSDVAGSDAAGSARTGEDPSAPPPG